MNKLFATIAMAGALAFAATAAFAADDGKNRRVVIQNLASQSVFYFYASPVDHDSWEEDLLGSDGIIAAGDQRTANIDNGTNQCYYDLKVVMKDGKAYIRRNVNVCAANKWVIGDSGESLQ